MKPKLFFNMLSFTALLMITMSSCSNSKIIITSDFLINNNSKGVNSLEVIEIFPADNLTPPILYTESAEFRYASVVDSSFKLKKGKVFFTKPQEGYKWVFIPLADSAWIPTPNQPSVNFIGKLKNNSWYLFKGLHIFGYLYFVYIDNSGAAKIYEVNKSNY
jgi:hypothetical protein